MRLEVGSTSHKKLSFAYFGLPSTILASSFYRNLTHSGHNPRKCKQLLRQYVNYDLPYLNARCRFDGQKTAAPCPRKNTCRTHDIYIDCIRFLEYHIKIPRMVLVRRARRGNSVLDLHTSFFAVSRDLRIEAASIYSRNERFPPTTLSYETAVVLEVAWTGGENGAPTVWKGAGLVKQRTWISAV